MTRLHLIVDGGCSLAGGGIYETYLDLPGTVRRGDPELYEFLSQLLPTPGWCDSPLNVVAWKIGNSTQDWVEVTREFINPDGGKYHRRVVYDKEFNSISEKIYY